MKSRITNVAQVSVLPPIANQSTTLKHSTSTGATCIRSHKGRPFEILEINSKNRVSILGNSYAPRDGFLFDQMKQLEEALSETPCLVVRVVNAEKYQSPMITISRDDQDELTKVSSLHKYNQTIPLADKDILQVTVKDGDVSSFRSLRFTWSAEEENRVTIRFFEKNQEDEWIEIEQSLVVSDDLNAKDDFGRPAFIEAVFENQCRIFNLEFNGEIGDLKEIAQKYDGEYLKLEGGTDGGVPEESDYINAWNLLKPDEVKAKSLFLAGLESKNVITHVMQIADYKQVSVGFDIPGSYSLEGGVSWLEGLSYTPQHGRQAQVFYCPYYARDSHSTQEGSWGYSGAWVAAIARGDQKLTGTTPGVHYSPAGMDRGFSVRSRIRPIHPQQELDREKMVKHRINPVIAKEGILVVDDALTLSAKDNYFKFTHVNRIFNYVAHRFFEEASALKHQPDGIARVGLDRILREILSGLDEQKGGSGALVKPRYEEDGSESFTYEIEQVEIDLWSVRWNLSVSGVARRIAGQPALFR